MRGPERRVADQRPVGQGAAGGRVHPGHRERLFGVSGGQQAGQALGQHGLARARRAHHQEVVPTGRRHLEGWRPKGCPRTSARSGGPGRGAAAAQAGRAAMRPAPQDLGQLGQRRHAVYLLAPDQRGLPHVAQGHDQPEGAVASARAIMPGTWRNDR